MKRLVVAFLFAVSSSASAQIVDRLAVAPDEFNVQPQAYGTEDESVISVPPFAFNSRVSTETFSRTGYRRFINDPTGCCLEAPLHLPNGALITAIEIEGCDTSPTGVIHILLARCFTTGCAALGASAETTPAYSSGCV